MGKTRLVLEALQADRAIAQRVLVATTVERGRDAMVKHGLLARHPSVFLVVDDCTVGSVQSLAADFEGQARVSGNTTARLLVITPAARPPESLRVKRIWQLPPLDDAANERLARELLGTGDAAVDDIVKLSEGFPWFTTLLAHAASNTGAAPPTLQHAFLWALAAPFEAPESELRGLRLRRARGLMAILLTPTLNWSDAQTAQREQLARAVGAARWDDVHEAALECRERGIARYGPVLKYVTPQVLERELLEFFFGPEGPDPKGTTLREHAGEHLEGFLQRLRELDVRTSIVRSMVDAEVANLAGAPPGIQPLADAGLLGSRLRFAARHEPVVVASLLAQRIEALSLDELCAERASRRWLLEALQELVTRRGAFDAAEAALFRLAVAENEAYFNNASTSWSWLFFPGWAALHASLSARVARLEAHTRDADPRARLVALGGVRACITTNLARLAYPPWDGPPPPSPPDDVQRARERGWELLGTLLADPEPSVVAEAKKLAAAELRGSIRTGVGVMALTILGERSDAFDEDDRVPLRDALRQLRLYDAGQLGALEPAVTRLERLLEPRSFSERLRQQVGSHGPAKLRGTEAQREADDALAAEALAGDAPILRELDWLSASARGHVFAYALGQRDRSRVLFQPLLDLATRSTEWRGRVLLGRYLRGWVEDGREEAAEQVVSALLRDPARAYVVGPVLAELGLTDERAKWLEQAVRSNALDPHATGEVARRAGTLAGVTPAVADGLLDALIRGTTPAQTEAGLAILVRRLSKDRATTAEERAMLREGLERLATAPLDVSSGEDWEAAALHLVEHGEAPQIAALALVALAQEHGPDDTAWRALHAAAEADPPGTWAVLQAALAREDGMTARLLVDFQFHRGSFPWPVDQVLAWVGHEERRGRAVASLVRPYGDPLHPVLRALLERFGPWSTVASEIEARLHSTDGAVSSFAEHDERQLTRVRSWKADGSRAVRDFAERVEKSLARSHEEHAAREEAERRRYGT